MYIKCVYNVHVITILCSLNNTVHIMEGQVNALRPMDPEWMVLPQQEAPAWSCPLCRMDWYREPDGWVSDALTLPREQRPHPMVTGGCAACASRRAALSQLRKTIAIGELHEPLLRRLLRIARWQPEEEVLRDAAEAIYLYMPDAFADAAREVIDQSGSTPLLWQVMEQGTGRPPAHVQHNEKEE